MYRQTPIKLLSPTSEHLTGEAYQEANEAPQVEWQGNAIVRRTSQTLARSRLGEAANNLWSVRATLPRDIHPEPGWEVHCHTEGRDRTLHVVGATQTDGTWAMNCDE